ncbi:MAG TPA: YHYH protein [Flavobacteriales bacterium]|nr:YHYH protein [Flavobacteriales bacterium]
MKRTLLILLVGIAFTGGAQPVIDSWIMNTTGLYASFWENTATTGPPNYVYQTTTDSADVLQVCYTTDSVWVRAEGMTNDMGKYLNPGTCDPQGYVFRIPRNSTVPSTKTESPKVGAIGVLTNGIPIYGLSNSYSWNGTINTNMGGLGIWNVEVYLSEGFVLDTAFAAHPQQDGAYHSHATPWRLFNSTPSTQHSPLVGYAFDGYPVYGPYGYSTPMSSASAVTRMKTGYSLRSITVRQTLPDGTVLSAGQYGPAVSSTYPIGTYCEDYEWLAANGGDLDEYNGRFCVTPEYPSGTYAYFVTMDATGTPEFPYYIGINYYGDPDDANLATGPGFTYPTIPSTGTTCVATGIDEIDAQQLIGVYPNPNNGNFNVFLDNNSGDMNQMHVFNQMGEKVYTTNLTNGINQVSVPATFSKGLYFVRASSKSGKITASQRVIVQ